MSRILQGDGPPLPQGHSDLLGDFLGKCFVQDPSHRATAQSLLSNPWIAGNKEVPNKVRI